MSRAASIVVVAALWGSTGEVQAKPKAPERVVGKYEGGYTLRCPPREVEYPTCELSGPGRTAPLPLPSIYAEHYHGVEVRTGHVFWVRRAPKATDEVHDTEWATGKDRVVVAAHEFRASWDGRELFFQTSLKEGEDGERLILWQGAVSAPRELDRHEDGFLPLGWSRDGRWFWYGRGVVGGWSELMLWERSTGTSRVMPHVKDSQDFVLDPDTGRYAFESLSENNTCFDAECREDREKSGPNRLIVRNAFDGSEQVVAESKRGTGFSARWEPDGSLVFTRVKGKQERWRPTAPPPPAPKTPGR